jgi:hypothetical protein
MLDIYATSLSTISVCKAQTKSLAAPANDLEALTKIDRSLENPWISLFLLVPLSPLEQENRYDAVLLNYSLMRGDGFDTDPNKRVG